MVETEVKTQKFIVKYFPEIMVKGAKAKRQMTDQLLGNLKKIVTRVDEKAQLRKFFDKIEIICNVEFVTEIRLKLMETPGIEVIQEAIQIDNMNNLDEIKEKVNEVMSQEIIDKTFVVRAKRTGVHDFKSVEMEKTVGGYMLAMNPQSKGVKLKGAEVTINIELINDQLNIITHKFRGLSGFPLGTQGEVLSLMSGGFDSTIASFLMMKRGIKTNFIFFNLGGTAHEIGVKQVAFYLWNKFGSTHKVTFTTVHFEDVVTEIFNSIGQSYMGVMLKRLMLMAAEKIANEKKIDALVTGESIAQVSSQTLRNLALIDQVTNKLVIRPLATMNKPDIMEMAAQIGTRKFAEAMPEYCGVISKNPVINGSFDKMAKEAKKFNYEVLENAVLNAQEIFIDEIIDKIEEIAQVEIVNDLNSGNYTVIDIRQGNECIKCDCETLKIPFYSLKNQFKKLPQDRQYLFYCDKGILSQLHAQYLIDSENYTNIKVYRPL